MSRTYEAVNQEIQERGGASGDHVMERVKELMPGLMNANVALDNNMSGPAPSN
jgi:hypothetical protein